MAIQHKPTMLTKGKSVESGCISRSILFIRDALYFVAQTTLSILGSVLYTLF